LAEDAENHINSAWEEKRGGGTDVAGLSYLACGGCTEKGGGVGEGRSALVLDAACLYLILHYVSLSHISGLLWGSPSI
jgi:hypothetical protein